MTNEEYDLIVKSIPDVPGVINETVLNLLPLASSVASGLLMGQEEEPDFKQFVNISAGVATGFLTALALFNNYPARAAELVNITFGKYGANATQAMELTLFNIRDILVSWKDEAFLAELQANMIVKQGKGE